jgi:flagellar biosynthesis/type III secretory pathway M-ring protein FliF/YscJ
MGGSGNLPIGPGVWGFIALFVLAIALWLLVRNMNARLRRMAYREHERLEVERKKAEGEDGGPSSTEKG